MLVEGVREQRSEAVVDGFTGSSYMVQTDVKLNSGSDAEIFVRYQDAHNAYRVRLDSSGNLDLDKVVNGYYTSINSTTYTTGACKTVTINLSGTGIKVWVNRCSSAASLKITATDSAIASGGVALGGDQPKYDDLKIGLDGTIPSDGDMEDMNDYVIINETFDSTDVTYAYDHAGNLVADGRFEYVYDAWNRLVKVQSIANIDPWPPAYQKAEFDGSGRRLKKVVTNSGEHNKTEVYLYDGQKIIETRNGSGNMVSQFIHGTQYIDELVMMRVKDKGDLYVHQAERDRGGSVKNWNVIGLTDLRGSLVERYDYTPYGTIKVHQLTSYGDRDGDHDVDSTDKGTPGTTCTGTVTEACRILDLDFDGDYDSTDATKFDALAQGISQHPGRRATAVDQPFGHQGLLYEPEIGSYQNRARQYSPGMRRFAQSDPLGTQDPTTPTSYRTGSRAASGKLLSAFGIPPRNQHIQYVDGCNLYAYLRANPVARQDAFGTKCDSRCTAPAGPEPPKKTYPGFPVERFISCGNTTGFCRCCVSLSTTCKSCWKCVGSTWTPVSRQVGVCR